MKKFIFIILAFIIALMLTACRVGNREIGWDDTQTFTYVIVELGNGELIEGEVTSWRDFSESDAVQFTMNDITYLTHYSKVILTTRKP